MVPHRNRAPDSMIQKIAGKGQRPIEHPCTIAMKEHRFHLAEKRCLGKRQYPEIVAYEVEVNHGCPYQRTEHCGHG